MRQENPNPLPNEKGGTILGMAAKTVVTPERPAPIPEIPKTETEPETTPFPRTKRKKHTTLPGIAARVTIAAGLLTSGAAAYDHHVSANEPLSLPGITRDIQSIPGQITEWFTGGSDEVSPTFFDDNATEGVVGPNTFLYMPQAEFDKLPSADEEGKPLFNFPWDPNHPIEIKYHKSALDDFDIRRLKSGGVIDAEKYKGYATDIFSDSNLPVGYEFPALRGGRLSFMGSVYDEVASRKSPSNPYGQAVYNGPIIMARIEFIAPNGNLNFVNIFIEDNQGNYLPLQPLIDAPLESPMWAWEKGTLIEGLQKIFRTTKEGKLHMNIQGALNGGLSGLNADRVPGDFNFKVVTDATGIQKIPLPEPK